MTAGEPTAGPTALVDQSDCRARIEAVNLANAVTIDAVDECRFTAGGAQTARDVLSAGGSRDQLWAAVWVYSSAATDPAPLGPMLQNGDASISVLAAAAVVRLGDRAGLAVLSAALADDGYLVGSLPPISVSQFAAYSLSRSVRGAETPPRPASLADERTVADAWRSWLDSNATTLTFDRATSEWAVP